VIERGKESPKERALKRLIDTTISAYVAISGCQISRRSHGQAKIADPLAARDWPQAERRVEVEG
jgi:hypothetical protein